MAELDPVSTAQRFQNGQLNAGLNETLSGIEVVKSTVQESFEKRKFLKNAGLYRDSFVAQGIIQARYLPLLFLSIALAAAFGQGMWLLSQNELSVGELVAYMGLMGVLRFPTFISIFTFSLVQMGIAWRRAYFVIDARRERVGRESTGLCPTDAWRYCL